MTQLREGFTTGSCAAACALASCLWQRDGECPSRVAIAVPAGKTYAPEIHPLALYRCGVYKDSGDDPDITGGSEVWAEVRLAADDGPVSFAAGEGVGVVTKPGLKLPVGEAAINDILCDYMDYRTIASWAKEAMASCYANELLDTSAMNAEPAREILRCEVAEMLYRMLVLANLI